MKKLILLSAALMSFTCLANETTHPDIPEVVVGANLQTNILERKEQLRNDMVITPQEMKVIFSDYYRLEFKKLEDFDFKIEE